MRSSFSQAPKAPMRGQNQAASTVAKQPDFEALAKARAPQGAEKAYPNPEWMKQQAPAQAPKKMEMQKPETKTPGGMTGDYSAPPKKPAQVPAQAPDARAAALQTFGAKIEDKSKYTPEMAGGYVKPKVALGDPTASIDYAGIKTYQDSRDATKNPGPGWTWDAKYVSPDGQQGMWVKESLDKIPAGVSLDDPGWVWSNGEWVYDANLASSKGIDTELAEALQGNPEDYGMSKELLGQSKKAIAQQAAQSKTDISQSLAGRGLGASGLVGSGFAGVDVGAMGAMTDLDVQNWQAGADRQINMLKTLLTARGNEMSEKQKAEVNKQIADLEERKFTQQVSDQAESDDWVALNNMMMGFGAELWTPDSWAWAKKQLANGVPPEVVAEYLKAGGSGGKTIQIDQESNPDGTPKDIDMSLYGDEEPAPEPTPTTPPDDGGYESGKKGKLTMKKKVAAYEKYVAQEEAQGDEPLSFVDWNKIYGD